jgi:hypothetical protein
MNYLDSKSNFNNHKKPAYELRDASIRSLQLHSNQASYPVLFDHDQQLFEEGLDELLFWYPTCIWRSCPDGKFEKEAQARLANIKSQVAELSNYNEPEISIESTHLVYLCHPFGSYAYGHLLDTLQRLFSLETAGYANWKDCTFLVSNHRTVTDFSHHLSALTATHIRQNQILQVDPGKCYRSKSILFGLPASYETQLSEDSHQWLVSRYRSYFLSEDNYLDSRKYKLYLARNHVVKGSRGVVNEQEIMKDLQLKGYKVITGNEPLFQIIHYFSNAEIVLGAHGSLFANTVFCRNQAKIYEYCSALRVDKSFLNKRKEAADYTQIIVDSDEFYNISIPLDQIP